MTVEDCAHQIKLGFITDPHHYDKADVMAEIDKVVQPLIGALEDITTVDDTSTLAGAVAIAKHALESVKR